MWQESGVARHMKHNAVKDVHFAILSRGSCCSFAAIKQHPEQDSLLIAGVLPAYCARMRRTFVNVVVVFRGNLQYILYLLLRSKFNFPV